MVDAEPQRRDGEKLGISAAHPAECKEDEADYEEPGGNRRAPGDLLDRETGERRQCHVGGE